MTDLAPRTTYRSVYAAPGFAGLHLGASLSMAGISLQVLAFSVAVYDATRSPLWTSIAFAAGFLPQVLGGLVLPSLADRVPPRLLLPAGSLLRAVVAALLAAGWLGLGGGVALVAAATLVQPLFSAGQSGLVSRLLDGDRYVLGRSLFTATSMIAQLAGLAAGGAVLQAVGAPGALLVAAGAEALGAAVLAAGVPSLPAAGARARWRLGETWAGYRRVLAVPSVRTVLLLEWVPLGLSVGAESLAVPYAGAQHAGGLLTALLVGAPPLGALAGELAVGRWCRPATRARLVLPLLLLLGALLLPLAATPPAAVAAGLVLIGSVGLAYPMGRQAAFRDALPAGEEALGFGLLGVGMMTAQGVGPLLAGPLATAIGAGPAMAACGGAVLLSAVLLRRGATDPVAAVPSAAAAGA